MVKYSGCENEDLKSKYVQWDKRDLQSKMRTYVRAFEDFIMFISITSKTDIVMRKTVEPLKPRWG